MGAIFFVFCWGDFLGVLEGLDAALSRLFNLAVERTQRAVSLLCVSLEVYGYGMLCLYFIWIVTIGAIATIDFF